ncbi:MAG: hypothetical protein AB7G39_08560 [Alphaproteobacteria bacterium]
MTGEPNRWRRFWRVFLAAAGGAAAFVYAFVLIADPYDTLPFSPPFERYPVSSNQRFSFPALAVRPAFDSAIIGTSTTRLLRPAQLDRLFEAHFVNLSMNSATTYEQMRIYDLFVDTHPAPKVVIFGIDMEWCIQEEMPELTFRPFPPWLYDGNPWNDALYLFNFTAVEQAVRQIAQASGLQPVRYGRDGYTDFLPPASEYDLAKAQDGLYHGAAPGPRPPADPPEIVTDEMRRGWSFAQHPRMAHMLRRLPAGTVKVLVMVPYHHFRQPVPNSADAAVWEVCKQRLAAIAGAFPNAHTLDFMIPSEITREDRNYWDPLHYSVETAARLGDLIAEGVRTRQGRPDLFRYLVPEN